MSGIIRATAPVVADALSQADEHDGLLQAITEEGVALNPSAVLQARKAIGHALLAAFPNSNAAKEIAMLVTVLANMCADDLMSIERANPISDAGRDGRVSAVLTFFERLLKRAATERALLAMGTNHINRTRGHG